MAGTDQRSGDHFIDHPDEVKLERDDGKTHTFCWMEHDRVCTGGCQAFDPMYADDETGRFTACRILNLGIVMASAASNFVKSVAPPPIIPGTNIKPMEVK